ncbi:MAG: hypothetical protein SFT93_05645 [Rickettsiaceae bacterium]|nr:hypothetical protein [Rickettsiaceae bacterium]
MRFNFCREKNEKLLKDRAIGFEEIITEIELGGLVCITKHYNFNKYPNQEIMYVRVQDVIYMVPYIIEKDGAFFLKTLYPSRKATKKYIKDSP